MDLRCILVAMFVYLFHGLALYWSAAMMISDQANSFLKVINFSFKALTYRIPLASFFVGHSITPKSHHQHVMRSQTSLFALQSQNMK